MIFSAEYLQQGKRAAAIHFEFRTEGTQSGKDVTNCVDLDHQDIKRDVLIKNFHRSSFIGIQ